MFDIGWTELLVIAIVLIVVVGPKDLPPMLRAFGKMTTNLRKMAGDFRAQFDEALKESELDDVRKTISDAQRLNPTNALRDAINPLRQMGQEIRADLQKATQLPTAGVSQTDAEAQQAVEGTSSVDAAPEIPANFPSLTVPPVTTAPAQSVPAAAEAVAAVAEKPKPVRKTAAKAKPVPEAAEAPAAPAALAEKPKRSRAAPKPAPVTQAVEEAVVKAPARKRTPKKADTPKDDA
ncbi:MULTISPECIES: Sec-independent protein translocase protein TatB [unclassified Neorhizobium]|uniref:Sec-independent protein translocase protein TatB n=1 Tax=unclassified Neorhizobium TaxID=2629175 RepID=UPI001FF2D025|nr:MULTISPECIES: Sec-independent protein translocase protein TatB [unclassified Neorhizobium]MCJ9674000.1 Sec-independent protein translocase protein TatB [Neorhizobium sp. SHOUNA12B]MCJ9744475.1 Sec-independent protein translocase protein TatB [Neorhizobium sp. SHOUNA12A]